MTTCIYIRIIQTSLDLGRGNLLPLLALLCPRVTIHTLPKAIKPTPHASTQVRVLSKMPALLVPPDMLELLPAAVASSPPAEPFSTGPCSLITLLPPGGDSSEAGPLAAAGGLGRAVPIGGAGWKYVAQPGSSCSQQTCMDGLDTPSEASSATLTLRPPSQGE